MAPHPFRLFSGTGVFQRTEAALREREERFRAAVEAMLDAFGLYSAIHDKTGRIVDFRVEYVNAAACAATGLSREQQVGRQLLKVFPHYRNTPLFGAYCAVAETGEPFSSESFLVQAVVDGRSEQRWFDIRISKSGDGVVSTWREITERKRELARQEAATLVNARLLEEEQAANRAKDRFLANLSHELRTPLTPMLAVIARLERRPDLLSEEREALAMLRRNVELEVRLVDDLLDLTRITHQKMELHPRIVDVRQVLSQSLDTCFLREVSMDRRLESDLRAGEHRVWGDSSRLTQVFTILLHNAAKFTSSGSRISMRSWNEGSCSAPGGFWLIVEVEDDGAGIEPGVLPRIFEPFEQGPSGRGTGGLGLGLAIGKALVELHGGCLTAASEGRDRGTVFKVRLPIGREVEEAGPQDAGAERGCFTAAEPAPLRILLTEDHPDTALALADLLAVGGHQVTVAGSVTEALAQVAAMHARGEAFDLLVSDLGLPDGSGLDLMRELSARHGLRGIALSGYGMAEDIRGSREAGFARHLTKPVDFQDLQDAIRQVMGRG